MMKNITLLLLLFMTTFSYATTNMACGVSEVTILHSGLDNPVSLGEATTITVCLPDCPFLEEMEAGAGLSVDIELPDGDIRTLKFKMSDYVSGTNTCFFLKYAPKNCGEHKVQRPYFTDSIGNTTFTTSPSFTNGNVYYVDGPTFNNNFQVTAYESGFWVTAQNYGLQHVWTINGVVTDCESASCSLDGLPGNTYTICHRNVINSACSNVQICKTVETLCPSEIPSIDHIEVHNTCGEDVYVKTLEFDGIEHNIRTREFGQSDHDWRDSGFSFSTNRLNPCTFEECSLIEIQVQTRCNGVESPWSESFEFTTRPYRPVANFATQATNTTIKLALGLYTGDWIQFKYWKAGVWPLQVEYALATGVLVNGQYIFEIPNLDPGTTYRYHARRRCGSSGLYSCWSTPSFFTTLGGTGNRQGIEEELIIENHKSRIVSSPNPSNGRFTIAGDLVKVGNQMTIHNLMGKQVIERTISDDINMEFNLDLEAGTYFLTIVDRKTGKLTSERIVVQNL